MIGWLVPSTDLRIGTPLPERRLDAAVGYALDGPERPEQTPYAALALGDAGSRALRIGWQLALGPCGALEVEGILRHPANGNAAEHGVLIRVAVRW